MTRRSFLAALPFTAIAQSTRPLGGGATACLDAVEARILELVDRERKNRGLAPLRLDETLRGIARNHDDDMLARGFFSHVNPSGEDPGARVARQDRRLIGVVGENIWESSGAYASQHTDLAAEIMKGWMNSEGHRENILRKEFTHIGAGVCAAGREIRATQEFANVQALLIRPLPAVVRSGSPVDLSTSGKAPDLFDIWSKRSERAVAQPAPMFGAKIVGPPGFYVVRFYFGNGPTHFTIYEGPGVEIR
jgi:uncharacterized protein YkwD